MRQKNQLEQTTDLQSSLLDLTLDSIIAHDLQGTVIYANQAAAETRGHTVDELLGKKIYDLVSPGEPHRRRLALLQDLRKGDGVQQFESVHLRKDGSEFPVEVQGRIGEMNGEKVFLGVARDITERRRCEVALQESGAKYRELVESASSIILRLDTRGNITFFNEFAQTFFGYREEEIIGQNVVGTIVPERDSVGNDLTAKLEDVVSHPERYQSSENENICRNGNRVWVAWTNKAILDSQGNLSEILCVGIDRTELRRVEKSLAESETRFRTLFESAPDPIFLKDRDCRYTGLNPAAQKFFDLPVDSILGQRDQDLFGEQAVAQVWELDQRVLNGEMGAILQTLPFRKGPTPFHTVKAPLRDEAGNITGICGIARDISDLRQVEEALKRLSRELERRVIERTAELESMKSRIHQIIATTPAVIVIADIAPPYNITFVSNYLHQLGLESEDLLGTPLFDFHRVHPDDHSNLVLGRMRLTQALERLDEDCPLTVECRWGGGTGRYIWVQGKITIETDASGTPVEIVGCWIDLTRQKTLEQRLEILSGPTVKLKVWERSNQTLQILRPTILPQSWPILKECLQAALTGDTTTGVTLHLKGKHGESLLGLLTAGPVKKRKGASGETIGAVIELNADKTGQH